MRTLLAMVIFAGGMLALDATAQEAGKSKRSARAAYAQKAKKAARLKAETLCEERARNEDPTGQFAAFPCWAREAFARGQRIDNR
jgi:hypothetical protein